MFNKIVLFAKIISFSCIAALVIIILPLSFAKNHMTTLNNKPIKIGAIFCFTGGNAPVDIPAAQGAKLAVHAINAKGGLLGRKIELLVENCNSYNKTIDEIAHQFANDPDISIVVGLSSSKMIMQIVPILAKAHKIFFSTGATSEILAQKIPTYLFLTCFTDNVQAVAAAEYAYEFMHFKQGAILYDQDTTYARSLKYYFTERFTQLGGKIISTQSFKHDDTQLLKQIRQLHLLKQKPEFIYLAAQPASVAVIIKAIRQSGIDTIIMGGDSYNSQFILQTIGAYTGSVIYTTHGVVNPELSNLLRSHMQQYKEMENFFKTHEAFYRTEPESVFSALGYDTINFIATAITKAQSTDVSKLLTAFHDIDSFIGVTGEMNYKRNAQTTPKKTVSIVQIDQGKSYFIGNWIPAKIPPYSPINEEASK